MTPMRHDRADIHDVLSRGQSGPFPHALLSADELLALSKLCLARSAIIHTAEAFAVTPDAEELCMEFSMLTDPLGGWAPTWPERATRSHEEIRALVAEVKAQSRTIMFAVWLDYA